MKLRKNLIVICVLLTAGCAQSVAAGRQLPKNQDQVVAYNTKAETANTGEARSDVASDYFKVAVLVPLSGEGAALGRAMLNSAMLALDDQARYVHLSSAKFVLIPKDTRSSPSEASEAFNLALRQGAEVVLGPVYSNSLQTVLPEATAKGIPVLSFSNNSSFAGRGAFLMGFSPEQQIRRAIDYEVAEGRKNFAALLPNDAYGGLIARFLKTYFTGNSDAALVEVAFYPPGAQDISIELAKLVGGDVASPKFDALLMPEGGGRLESMAAALTKLALDKSKFTVIGSGQWDDDRVKFPEKLDGAVFASSDPSRRRDFESHYADVFGMKPPRLASLAYDSTAMLVSYAGSGAAAADVKSRLERGESFLGPVDGLFRSSDNGIFERGLAVLRISGGSVKVADSAPEKF